MTACSWFLVAQNQWLYLGLANIKVPNIQKNPCSTAGLSSMFNSNNRSPISHPVQQQALGICFLTYCQWLQNWRAVDMTRCHTWKVITSGTTGINASYRQENDTMQVPQHWPTSAAVTQTLTNTSRELSDTLHQPGSGRSAKSQFLSITNTILLTFPLPGDQLYPKSQLGLQKSHQPLPKGHIKQWAQSSPPHSGRHIFVTTAGLHGWVLQTPGNTKHIWSTLTQAWLCWRGEWQHKSKNIFSFSLKRDFLSQLALFIQCRGVTGFKNRMTHTCLDVYELCAATEDVWRKCQEGLSTVLWRWSEVIANVFISESRWLSTKIKVTWLFPSSFYQCTTQANKDLLNIKQRVL